MASRRTRRRPVGPDSFLGRGVGERIPERSAHFEVDGALGRHRHLSTGQTVTAAQIGKLVGEGLVEIPRHQAVRNRRAEGGWYLRSLANDTTVDNLIR
jgi:hypothetical protein